MARAVDAKDRLTELLEDLSAGGSQATLANRIGVTQAAVNDWINQKSWPNQHNMTKIASVAGYDLGRLMAHLQGVEIDRSLTVERIIRELDLMPTNDVVSVINAAAHRLAERTAPYKVS